MQSIVFLHNPKAGGTAVTSFIKNLYSSHQVAPILESSASTRCHAAWIPHRNCLFVSGHFGHEVRESHFPNHWLITNFRHPVSRIQSLYRYWRAMPQAQMAQLPAINGPSLAKKMNFSDFIASEDPFLRMYISNFHARQIIKSGWLWWKCDEADLRIAKARVEAMNWFYVCESPQISISWLKSIFPEKSIPDILPMTNETSKRNDFIPTWQQVGVILERNRLDMELYTSAFQVISAKSSGFSSGIC